MSKPTLKEQIQQLSSAVEKLQGVNIVIDSGIIEDQKVQISELREDVAEMRRQVQSLREEYKDSYRKLLSCIILSNASKPVDYEQLTKSADHLAKNIK